MNKLLGAVMVAVAGLGFIGVFSKPPPNPGGASVILALIAAGGAALLWNARKKPAKAAPEEAITVERTVLRVARALRGRVTAAEIAAESGLPIVSIQAELERLEKAGACLSLLGESGIMVYLFSEFESADAKKDIFHGEERARKSRATESQ